MTAYGRNAYFPHHKQHITSTGQLLPQPWSRSQRTPLPGRPPTLAQDVVPADTTPSLPQLVASAQQALSAARAAADGAALLAAARQQGEQLAAIQVLIWGQLGALWLQLAEAWPTWRTSLEASAREAGPLLQQAGQGLAGAVRSATAALTDGEARAAALAMAVAAVGRVGRAAGLQRVAAALDDPAFRDRLSRCA